MQGKILTYVSDSHQIRITQKTSKEFNRFDSVQLVIDCNPAELLRIQIALRRGNLADDTFITTIVDHIEKFADEVENAPAR